MKDKLSDQEIFNKINELDFEKLMEPYRDGGTENKHIRRTIAMEVDWLVNRKRYPVEVAGGALLLTFMRIMKEGQFKGDGSYGSAGNEFDQNVRQAADILNRKALLSETYKTLAEGRSIAMKKFIVDISADTSFSPWFIKMFSVKYWKYRRLLRKEKKNVAV